jgi:hypothetical protein
MSYLGPVWMGPILAWAEEEEIMGPWLQPLIRWRHVGGHVAPLVSARKVRTQHLVGGFFSAEVWPTVSWNNCYLTSNWRFGPSANQNSGKGLGPLHRRDWEPVSITLQALSLAEKVDPVQVRFTLEGPTEYVNSKMDVKSTWIPTWHQMDHVSWSLGLSSKPASWR